MVECSAPYTNYLVSHFRSPKYKECPKIEVPVFPVGEPVTERVWEDDSPSEFMPNGTNYGK